MFPQKNLKTGIPVNRLMFLKSCDVFTKIKNNIKEIMQFKKYLDCLLGV